MSFNGSGVFVVNSSGQPVVATTLITAAAFNALTADIATGLSTCLTKDGQTVITQNIPFNNKKITGLAAASVRTDGASLATIQDGIGVYVATVGGTGNAITLTPSPAITAYVAGQTFRFIASTANTGAVTVAVSGLAAQDVKKNGSTALRAGDIPNGEFMVELTYDGEWFMLGSVGGDFATITLATPQASTSGTAINFTGILEGVKRITIMFVGVSTNGTDSLYVRLGDAGGVETTGYLSTAIVCTGAALAVSTFTAGFAVAILTATGAASVVHGTVTLSLENNSTNTWVVSAILNQSDTTSASIGSGSKSLTTVLDRVQITTTGGVNTFDAGEINISYE